MSVKNLQKIATIEQKIKLLQEEQHKIEQGFATNLITILKTKNALTLDFNTLVGGLLTVIEAIKKNSSEAKEWSKIGEQFCSSKKSTKVLEPVE